MDWFHLETIEIDGVTRELIEDAHDLAQQVNEFRPLPDEVLDSINHELIGEQVFNSNAIEGSTLTLRETKAILEAGQVIGVGRKHEGQEAINLGIAIDQVQKLVDVPDSSFDEHEFLLVHEKLFQGIDESGGRYRSQPIMLTGAKFQPPDAGEVHDLMKQFFERLKLTTVYEPIIVASWVHWVITRIHPFPDGNGRMARLWLDLILYKSKLVPAIIRQEERKAYYPALEAADGGQFNPLFQIVTRSLKNTLQVYLNAQQEQDEVIEWATDVVGEVDERINDQRKVEYARWAHQMKFIRDAFERCASQINRASDGKLLIEIHPCPIIEQASWEALRAGTGASQTWFFRVFGRQDDLTVRYIFFFGHHFHSDADVGLNATEPTVCLLISEQVGDQDPIRLYELDDAPVTLREILVADHRVVRKRWDRSSNAAVIDLDITGLQVAQDFLKEVIYNRLTN